MKLSYETLTPNMIRRINDYLLLPVQLPRHAQAAIVFGNAHMDGVYLALASYLQQHVQCIALTGGVLKGNGKREALDYYEVLRGAGVPDADILVECQSANTKENVDFVLPLLAQRVGAVASVLAISSWYHSRRVLMSLKARLPNTKLYLSYYFPEAIAPANWHLSEESSRPVLHEVTVIPQYRAKGDLVPIQRHRGYFR